MSLDLVNRPTCLLRLASQARGVKVLQSFPGPTLTPGWPDSQCDALVVLSGPCSSALPRFILGL